MSDKPRQVQVHHRCYDPERTEKVFKGEHFLLTRMNMYTRGHVTHGFLRCLIEYVAKNIDRAIELE
jgi:hypothetical protein